MAESESNLPVVTSSMEPAWTADAEECYRDVVQTLEEEWIPFAVGGAFAIHQHTGIWRATKDLDLLLAASEVPRALKQLEKQGFETYIEDPIWLAKAHRGKYYVDLITGMGNACLMVDPSWIERSVPAEILGIRCRVLAAEEMIASKVFVAFRERFDGSDVTHLIRACGSKIDWNRLMHLLDEHWELLYWSLMLFAYVYPAHVELVPEHVWSEMSQRLQERVRHPDRSAAFRGSLVDPKMFAIDVSEWGERDLFEEKIERFPGMLQAGSSTGSG